MFINNFAHHDIKLTFLTCRSSLFPYFFDFTQFVNCLVMLNAEQFGSKGWEVTNYDILNKSWQNDLNRLNNFPSSNSVSLLQFSISFK